MNLKKTMLVAAAVGGMSLAATGCADKAAADGEVATGECWGVNACKGTGDCGGKGHSCAGKNTCKGKGWKKMSKASCKKKGGKFKG